MDPITIEDVLAIGRNHHGYTFCVGRVDDRWVGFASGETRDGPCLFLLPGISEDHVIGLADRREAILRTGAVVLDPEAGYGGVDEWLVPEDLRGDPESYRCDECGSVCCEVDHSAPGDDWEPFEDGP